MPIIKERSLRRQPKGQRGKGCRPGMRRRAIPSSTVLYQEAATGGYRQGCRTVPIATLHLLSKVEVAGTFPSTNPANFPFYRYSKAHGVIACQSCHESMHGLYPVRYEGPQKSVDLTSHEQALPIQPGRRICRTCNLRELSYG